MWWSRPGFLPRRTRPMPNRPPARAASWVIHSVPVRPRDGAERLDRPYPLLLDAPPPPPPTPQPEVSPPCAPPSTPASRPSARRRLQAIDSQLAALRAWVADHGPALAGEHVFRDEGYSGGRLDRPGLDALRDAVRDGAVGVVAVLTPDRLAREYAYQVLLLEEFRRAGAEVVFLQHPIS